ncbi:beta-ketoacyl synthase chain length factor [Vibrio taketomensis]|uniref:beta-ketoacyl synthase chain length factor n=1 Tax=Vibrio taketomensis TaxID=2572923 RepID=UPI001389AE59|nr:beta-ketoacyl synthase chain length factor [Vibrio taketomensis]
MEVNVDWTVSPNSASRFAYLGGKQEFCSCNEVPKSIFRRSSSLSKEVLSLSGFVTSSNVDYIVFATRHGELERTHKLLCSLAKKQELSPTQFAQSVHSTAAGLLTIANQLPVPFTTISAVEDTFAMALIEALVHLHNNPKSEVCVIYADECVPEELTTFVGEQSQCAIALKIRRGSTYSLKIDNHNNCEGKLGNVENIKALIYGLAKDKSFSVCGKTIEITWTFR